jgi:hypothetical protein
MEYLHPSIEKLIATAPTSAVAAAIGRDSSLTAQLEPFAGARLSVSVQDQPRSLIIGRWDDCAEAVLDTLSMPISSSLSVLQGQPSGTRDCLLGPVPREEVAFRASDDPAQRQRLPPWGGVHHPVAEPDRGRQHRIPVRHARIHSHGARTAGEAGGHRMSRIKFKAPLRTRYRFGRISSSHYSIIEHRKISAPVPARRMFP